MREYFFKSDLFRDLPGDQMDTLETLSKKIILTVGELLILEGEISFDFYVLTAGEMSILKKEEDGEQLEIHVAKAGDFLGELAFIESGVRSTTVKAKTPCELIMIDGEKIRNNHAYIDLFSTLTLKMGEKVSKRLRYTNEVTVKTMRAELRATKLLLASGRFMTSIVFITSLYIFSLGILEALKNHVPTTTPISIGLIIFFAIAALSIILRSGFPLNNYGLTLRNWRQVSFEAILFTIPIMVLIVLIKWIFIRSLPSLSHESVFQPFIVLQKVGVSRMDYILLPLAYAAFCPLQEFIARGVLQGSFHMFLQKKTWRSVWFAIFLGNLLFSATHAHTSLGFAGLAFFPGLFWGWLFYRQQSLVGVSISHIIVGIWAVFIVSFTNLV